MDELDHEFIERWKTLANAVHDPNPYIDPRFLLPSIEFKQGARELRLAIVETPTEVLAILAFTVERVRGLPRLSTFGPFMQYTFGMLQHPLISADNPADIWTCLLRGLKAAHGPGTIQIGMMPGEGPFTMALEAAATTLRMPIAVLERGYRSLALLSSAAVDREAPASDSVAAYLPNGGSSRARKRITALTDSLGHTPRIVDVANESWAIDRFLALQSSGWKGDVTRGGNTSADSEWMRAVLRAFSADGRLLMPALIGGEDVVYMDTVLRAGDGLFGFLDSYDERFAALSPGTLARSVVWRFGLARTDARSYDPNLLPRYAESSRLYPDQRVYQSVLIGYGGPLARLMVRGYPTAKLLQDRLRSWRRRIAR